MAEGCSDLTLLCIDNQHLFLLNHAAIFVPASGVKRDLLNHLPPQAHFEDHSNVNLMPCILIEGLFMVYSAFFQRSQVDLMCPLCLLVIEKYIFRYCPGCYNIWALVAVICLLYFLQADDWARVSTPSRQYFSTYIMSTVQHADLGLTE